MDGGGGRRGWRSSITHGPGLTDDSVSEMTSHGYFRVGAWKEKTKNKVCVSTFECNPLALFSEDINVNVQMLCMHKCHRGCLFLVMTPLI